MNDNDIKQDVGAITLAPVITLTVAIVAMVMSGHRAAPAPSAHFGCRAGLGSPLTGNSHAGQTRRLD